MGNINDAKKVLKYWKLVEFLNQQDIDKNFLKTIEGAIPSENYGMITRMKPLNLNVLKKDASYYISVWKVPRNDIVSYLCHNYAQKSGKDIKSIIPETMYEANQFIAGCSFEIKYDEDSDRFLYVKGTFKISPILWYLNLLEENKKGFLRKICEILFNNKKLDVNQFNNVEKYIELYHIVKNNIDEQIVANNKKIEDVLDICLKFDFDKFIERKYYVDRTEEYIASYRLIDKKINEMGNSFFSEELEMVEDGLDNLRLGSSYEQCLLSYITCLFDDEKNKVKRTNISSDVTNVGEKTKIKALFNQCLSLDKAPLGKWPSIYNPFLMQQLAINLSIDFNNPIISVNGPPGTGKTTLLKEIVADFVVKRACVLCELGKPSDLFEKVEQQNSDDKIVYYKIKDSYLNRIKRYNMLVASSNNNAVENITKELPEGKDIFNDSINHFRELEGFNSDLEINADYFQEHVEDLFDSDTTKGYWGAISAPLGKRANITKYSNFLQGLVNDIDINIQENSNNNQMGNDQRFNVAVNKFIYKLKEVVNLKNTILEVKDMSLKDIEGRIQSLTREIRQNSTNINNAQMSIFKKNRINNLKIEKQVLDSRLKSMQSKKAIFDQFQRIDDTFYDDYFENNERVQLINPWVTNEYNRLRIELFLLALDVHKAFILSSPEIEQNLKNYINIKGIKCDLRKMMPSLIQSIFLVTPVISTTFAAVKSFLKYVGKGDIGTLIIDEAGQAEPHMALGALYRCTKAIVVGDPKQIEPVVTSESDMFKAILRQDGIEKYQNKNNSVQSFADNINPYGRYLGDEWVGCPLVIHRRCSPPMFEISNKLSYNNSMINKSSNDEKNLVCIYDRSVWFNIQGKEGSNSHYVKEQGEFIVEMLHKKIRKSQASELFDIDDLYIISPFKNVVRDIKKDLKKAFGSQDKTTNERLERWLKDYVGTVHTFQGKGTNEVIFALGCDKNSMGAVKWVNKNLINVAATRAKIRLYFVGDYELWKNNSAFKSITYILDKYLDNPNDNASHQDEMICPNCGNKLVERTGRYGKFLACSNYPKCKHTQSIYPKKESRYLS